MSANARLRGQLNCLLQDLQADHPETMLVVRAAPVLTIPAFQKRLATLLPHSLLVVLGGPSDAPLDTFPAVVSLSTGPHHVSLPPDWTASRFHPRSRPSSG